MLCLSAARLPAQDPFLGKWKLNLAKSKLTGQKIAIEALPDNAYRFQEDEHSDVIFADGLDHPNHFGETMAITKKTPTEWAIVYKKDGAILLETVWKVSRNGKVLTYTATGIRPNGQRFNNEMTAKRVSGKTGLPGAWETVGVRLSSPREIYITPFERDGQTLLFPGRKETIQMRFDGRDYAEQGPTVTDGATTSGRRIDERTIETTEKVKGKVIETAKITISADGATQTIVITEPGDPAPVVLVYERESAKP